MSWRIRDARDFADALEGRARPSSREVASLIAVAERLCEAAAELQPSPAFQTSLRTSLMTEAATVLTATAPPVTARAHRRQISFPVATRRAAIAVAALATTFGLVGMTTASASALPGDTLYPVKRGVENARLALKRGDSERGAFRLELAANRVAEANGLVEHRSVPATLEADTLTAYSEQADQGSDTLVRSFKATDHRADIITINRFANSTAGQLEKLEGKLDGPAAVALAAAQTQLASIVDTTSRLCPACGGIDRDVISALTGPGPATEPGPSSPAPSPPDGAAPQTNPAPGPGPVGGRPAGAGDADEDSSNDSRDDDSSGDSDDASDSDEEESDASDEPEPSPSPRPSPSPSPTPSPSSTPTPAAPKADFTWSGQPGVGNELRVTFRDASSPDAIRWKWDFGDGSPTSQVKNPPRHTYPASGTYAVTLSVSNKSGGSNAVTKSVTVPVR